MVQHVGGTASTAVLDQYLRESYDVIQAVHDNLAAIRSVAGHLTPVEDVEEFRNEVVALHAKLGVLVAASELLVQVSPAGAGLVTAVDAAAQRTLLALGSAAQQDSTAFADAATFDALASSVAQLSDALDGVLLTLQSVATTDALTAALTPLSDRVGTLENQNLDTRITAILTDLQNGVYTGGVQGGLDALGDRVGALEGLTQSQGGTLGQLQSQVADQTQRINGQAGVLGSLTARVTQTENGLDAQAQQTVGLTTRLDLTEQEVSATADAVQVLGTRTTYAEGVLSTQAEEMTVLNARITDAHGRVDAQGSAVDQLTTRVTQTSNSIEVVASDVTALAARILDAEQGLEAQGTATDELTTQVLQTADGLSILSENVTELTANLGAAGNLAPNSGFEDSLGSWTLFFRGLGWLTQELVRNYQPERMPPEVQTLCVAHTTVPAGNGGIRSHNISVEGRKDYFLSGYLAAENCTVSLEYRVLDALGYEIDYGTAGSTTNGPATNLADLTRLAVKVPIPHDGALLQIQVWVKDAHTAPPRLWFARPQLEVALPGQTSPTAWAPSAAGVTGSFATAVEELTVRVTDTEELVESMSTSVTSLESNLDTTFTTAYEALERARAAEDMAADSLASLKNIAADNILTAREKPRLIQDYETLLAEKDGIRAEAIAAELVGELAEFDVAFDNLTNYLATLTTPTRWDDTSGDTLLT